jgi:hypothetical protein
MGRQVTLFVELCQPVPWLLGPVVLLGLGQGVAAEEKQVVAQF